MAEKLPIGSQQALMGQAGSEKKTARSGGTQISFFNIFAPRRETGRQQASMGTSSHNAFKTNLFKKLFGLDK